MDSYVPLEMNHITFRKSNFPIVIAFRITTTTALMNNLLNNTACTLTFPCMRSRMVKVTLSPPSTRLESIAAAAQSTQITGQESEVCLFFFVLFLFVLGFLSFFYCWGNVCNTVENDNVRDKFSYWKLWGHLRAKPCLQADQWSDAGS